MTPQEAAEITDTTPARFTEVAAEHGLHYNPLTGYEPREVWALKEVFRSDTCPACGTQSIEFLRTRYCPTSGCTRSFFYVPLE